MQKDFMNMAFKRKQINRKLCTYYECFTHLELFIYWDQLISTSASV